MRDSKKSLGIIGVGQFAEFFIPHLKPYFSEIIISSRNDKSKIAKKLNVKFAAKKEAAKKDIVLLSMPISKIENVLKEIKNDLKPDAIVMDVCSVKIYPVELMKKMLPNNVEILGTHPLFGPQNEKTGLKNLEIVLCPARINKYHLEEIKNIFLRMGLKVITTTPEKHDKVMAETQALTHFISKGVLKTISQNDFEFSTFSAKKMFEAVNSIKNTSPQLFQDMQELNPYAKKTRNRLLRNLNEIDRKYKQRGK